MEAVRLTRLSRHHRILAPRMRAALAAFSLSILLNAAWAGLWGWLRPGRHVQRISEDQLAVDTTQAHSVFTQYGLWIACTSAIMFCLAIVIHRAFPSARGALGVWLMAACGFVGAWMALDVGNAVAAATHPLAALHQLGVGDSATAPLMVQGRTGCIAAALVGALAYWNALYLHTPAEAGTPTTPVRAYNTEN